MNTQTSPSTLDPHLLVASKSDEDGSTAPSTLEFSPETQDSGLGTPDGPKPIYRKIAKLPKPLLDLINSMLDDGHTAPEIIVKLQASTNPPLPYPISEQNISDWRKSGYQKYLRHQDLRADIRFIRESAADFSEFNEEHQFQNTLIQLGLTDIYRELTDPQTRTDPLKHNRILNALARLNREALNLRKYNDLRADNAAAAQPIGSTRAPTAEEICNSFLTGFETVTGIKPSDRPIGPDINHILDPNGSALAAPKQSEGGSGSSSSPNPESSAPSDSSDNPQPAPLSPPHPEGLSDGSRRSEPAQTSGTDSRKSPHPGGMPDKSKIETQKPKMNHAPPTSAQPATCNAQPATFATPLTASAAIPAPQLSTPQPSTESAEFCYSCGVPVPPLKPDGTRPSPSCPGCHIRLYPPGTTYDHCPVCDAYQAISAAGERFSNNCNHCHQVLPPVGHRYTAECPSCGLMLRNFTQDGSRIAQRCPDCRTLLPLLEPVPLSPAAPDLASAGAGECTNQSTSPPQRQSDASHPSGAAADSSRHSEATAEAAPGHATCNTHLCPSTPDT